jgi:hypothetical protein
MTTNNDDLMARIEHLESQVNVLQAASRAPIQDVAQRLNMTATGRNALSGAFVIPYSSDAGTNNPASDPGIPADGNGVLYKDTPTTLRLSIYRRGVGWVSAQYS